MIHYKFMWVFTQLFWTCSVCNDLVSWSLAYQLFLTFAVLHQTWSQVWLKICCSLWFKSGNLTWCVLCFTEVAKAAAVSWGPGRVHQGRAKEPEEGVSACSGGSQAHPKRPFGHRTIFGSCRPKQWNCWLHYRSELFEKRLSTFVISREKFRIMPGFGWNLPSWHMSRLDLAG